MVNQRKSVEHLFEQALALKPGERTAFLDEACSSSPDLRQEVERLLAGHAEAGSFLKAPLFGSFATANSFDEGTTETCVQRTDGERRPGQASARQFNDNDVIAGRFRIVRYIDSGGMGEVYEVEDRQLQGVRLALKTILPHVAAKPDMRERFEREVLLARSVVHPNLCPIYDIFHCVHRDANLIFLTMKLLPGETLSARIKKREGPLGLTEAARIVRQVGSALTAAHDAGILHRDIKTANIMLDGADERVQACVTDFGLARAYLSESTVLTGEGVPGTPGYVAPELYQGVPPSRASDVYAFGVVVYKMLTGFAPPNPPEPGARAIRDPFIEKLPAEWKRLLGRCLEPAVSRRSRSIPEALDSFGESDREKPTPLRLAAKLSRRQMIAMGAGAAAAAAGGVWLEWPRIDFAMHPLPPKRFVALLDWPTASDARIAPMITAVVDAIGNELSRAEAFDHNLYIIPHHIGKDVASLSQLNDVRESLGANLVLAASGVPGAKTVELLLRVLGPAVSRTLRQKTIRVSMDEQLSLPEKAVRVAAELLNIKHYEPDDRRSRVGTDNTEAYAAFQDAQTLMRKDNDSGLDAAIERYKQAIEIDPRYATALAGLSWAYLRSYGLNADPAELNLASGNCQSAISLNPDLVDAHLALSSVYEQTGDLNGANREMAKALSLDPANAHTLIYQANFYAASNRWAEAEETFTRVLKIRPNYWLAHQELGNVLDMQGKYYDALNQFRAASLASPKNALALKNVGSVYLQLGRIAEALETLNLSLNLKEDDNTFVTLAQAYRVQQKFSEAIAYALRAVKLNPREPDHWLELGDSYASSGKFHTEADAAYGKAAISQEEALRISPKDGPGWMLLALCRIKTGQSASSMALVEKAESMYVDDIDSQLAKVRILELAGKREQALATIGRCLARGATVFQFQTLVDLEALRKDHRYQEITTERTVG